MSPSLVPVLPRGVDHAAIGLEELGGNLEDGEYQRAFRTPFRVAASWLPPHELPASARHTLRRSILVDQAALDHVTLFNVDVLVVRKHRTGRTAHQRRHRPGGAIE